MKIYLTISGLILAFGLFGLFLVRFREDSWICENNEWVMHGKPSNPKPTTGCGDSKREWQKQTFSEAGLTLTFHIPNDTTFRKEIAEDGDRIRAAAFYIEKGEKDNPTYQLYGLYQPMSTATEVELARIKTGMEPNSVKEVTIGGYKGIEGLIVISGPKNHFETVINKDGKLFSLATYPPTEESKALTDQVIQTIKFE